MSKEDEQIKTCFIVMPISDMDGYSKGHFKRVYEHLIKPACKKAGYKPIRADDVASSNYIVIDILSKIVDSELVICDLSGRNPNVLYELGIRQAFSLPTVLLKDLMTERIFDIQGLRTIEYDHTLRVDTVESNQLAIINAVNATIESKGQDVNSLIQLLGIKPASLPSDIKLSKDTSLILSAIKDLSSRVANIEVDNAINSKVVLSKNNRQSNSYFINQKSFFEGDKLLLEGKEIGTLVEVDSDGNILVVTPSGKKKIYLKGSISFETLISTPSFL